jgi:hypothetical protein
LTIDNYSLSVINFYIQLLKLMKRFPTERIKPVGGRLGATVFENTSIPLPKTLFFNIEIDLAEMDLTDLAEEDGDESVFETKFSLDFIRLNVPNLAAIENKTFHFPINPKEGYIDASVYLFSTHNYIDATKISFGAFQNHKIPAKIEMVIDFEFEGTGYANTELLTIDIHLDLGGFLIPKDLLDYANINPKNIKKLASAFFDIQGFGPPRLNDFGVAMQMKFGY